MDASLNACMCCPRCCGVDRLAGEIGACGAGIRPKVARAALHQWEEPGISGDMGSGAVFFSHCNLACVYCQNYTISQEGLGLEVDIPQLADIFIGLQAQGAHNINLVSGTHYIPQIGSALRLARSAGLKVPVVWNSNGYESIGGLKMLEGLVDIYLPDLKYSDDRLAIELSGAKGYWQTATAAVKEMLRQVGTPVFDSDGLVTKGVVVRHLVLPGHLDNTKDVLDWVSTSLPKGVYLSLMAQYFPTHKAKGPGPLGRRLTAAEYEEVVDYLDFLGIENGWVQDLDSSSEEYVPEFDLTGLGLPDSTEQ